MLLKKQRWFFWMALLIFILIFIFSLAFAIYAEQGSIGTYSIKPSFRVAVGYDAADDYEDIIKQAKSIIEECGNQGGIEECMQSKLKTFNAQQLLLLSAGSCEDNAKDLFYDFIEEYEGCANSLDNDCICEFSLDFNSYKLKGEYKIKLSKNGKIELEKPKGGISHTLRNMPSYTGNNPSELNERGYIDYFIEYNDDGSFKEAKLALEKRLWSDEEWPYETVKLFKRADGKIVFVRDTSNKDKCAMTKEVFKFCAVNTKKQFYVYSTDKEKPILQNPVIRFALFIKDLPPPQVEHLVVYDKKNSDKTIIIEWDKSKATDVKQYHIYYSKDDFLGWEIKNHEVINKNKKIAPMVVNAKLKADNRLKAIDFNPKCQFDELNKKCSFLFPVIKEDGSSGSIELKNNEAYLVGEKYIYTLNLKSDEDYNFAITAVDIAGNEIDNVNEKFKLVQGKNYAQGKAEDDLAPNVVELNEPQIKTKNSKKVVELTWSKPPTNIDGTQNVENDINYYNVYYEKSDFGSVDTSQVKSTSDSISIDIDINSLEKDKEYYFAVTAVDKNDNEFKEKVMTRKIKTPKS